MSALPVEYPLVLVHPGGARSRGAVVLPFPSRRVRTAAPPAVHEPARLRLTRRGRLAVTLGAVVVVAVVLAVAAGALVPAGGAAAEPAEWTSSVVVLPGQTLWEVAAAAGPSGDVRDTIEEIRALNDLPTSALTAGQVLRVPVTD